MSPEVAHLTLVAIVAVSILLMLLRPRGLAEVWWVGSGAVLLVVLHLVPFSLAVKAVREGSDVYFFLIGMMLLSELAKDSGLFDWVSSTAVHGAHGQRARLFTWVYAVGTLITVCLSNDATAVVLTPAVLSAVRKADVEPLPYLFACAMIANAASFVLPISNPANLVVFQTAMPSLARWLASFLLPSVLSILVTYATLRWVFRKQLRSSFHADLTSSVLQANGKLVLGGLGLVLVVLLAASARNLQLGLPTCLSALVITAVVCLRSRRNPLSFAKEISWSTLLLVAGLFVMVDALESLHLLRYTQAALTWAQHVPTGLAVLLVAFTLGVANNLVNNLPLGLVAGVSVQAAHLQGSLPHAALIGIDLGPNLSVTGSLATILWLLALRKEGLHVRAWDFLKVGLLVMPAALLAAVLGLLMTHLLSPR